MKIKFLTLNIWRGKLIKNVLAFLRKEDADIVVLQEVFNGLNQKLNPQYRAFSIVKRELGYPHSLFAPAFLDISADSQVENGNAIFSKFPINTHRIHFFDVPYGTYIDAPGNYERCPRILVHAQLQVETRRLNVFNIHGIYGLSGEDNQRRLAMSKTIVSLIKNKENVILAGDFNLPPQTETIRNIEKHLTSVFGDTLITTFNMKRKENPDYGKVAVDMIFVSKNLKIIKRISPQVDVSDHLPLVCVVEV